MEVGVFGFEFEGGFQLGDGAVVLLEAAEGFAEEAVDVGVEDCRCAASVWRISAPSATGRGMVALLCRA